MPFCTITGEKDARPQGFYVFHLTPNTKRQNFEEKLREFFTYINFLKDTENISPNAGTDDEIPKSSPKLAAVRKHKLFKYYNNKKYDNTKRIDNKITKSNNNTTKEDRNVKFVEETVETSTYKREKRISSITDTINLSDSNNYKTTLQDTNEDYTQSNNANSSKYHGKIIIENPPVDKETTNHQKTAILQDESIQQKTDKETTLKDSTTTQKDPTTTQRVPTLQRKKRFISLFRSNDDENDSLLFKMLEFLMKHRRNFIPVVTVMREINTLVKSANGELNHFSKERNNYIGGYPPVSAINYDLELGNESKVVGLMKRLLGLGPKGGRLSINGSRK